MARFLGFIKWVVVPISVGCAGYFFVAPVLTPSLPKAVVPGPDASKPMATGPSVDVAVEAPKPERRRRRTKRKPKSANVTPPPEIPTPEEPASDAGGSAGAATTGNDGIPPDSETRIG